MAVNQQHIAEKLNVSVATVSRSLKNDLSISAQTRAMVLDMARQMGYRNFNTAPQAQTAKSLGSEMLPICALIQSDAHPGMADYEKSVIPGVLSGMSNAVSKYKSSLIVHYVPLKDRDRANEPDVLPRIVREGQCSGIVLIHNYPDAVVKKIARKYHCVSIIYNYHIPNMDIAANNHLEAINIIFEKMFNCGHREIGFLGEHKADSCNLARCSAYVESILKHDLPLRPDYIFDTSMEGFSASLISRVVEKINRGLSAIICSTDDNAYKLIRALKEKGINAPEQLSISGMDCDPIPPGMPPLTSVKIPCFELGTAAVELIHNRLEHPSTPARQIILNSPIVDRGSILPHFHVNQA